MATRGYRLRGFNKKLWLRIKLGNRSVGNTGRRTVFRSFSGADPCGEQIFLVLENGSNFGKILV